MTESNLEKTILSNINLNHKLLQDGVAHLIEWLKKQPHLPDFEDHEILKAFIVGSKSIERAKERLDKFFTSRANQHTLFSQSNRDPNNLKWHILSEIAYLPNMTEDGNLVSISRNPYGKEVVNCFDFIETCKHYFMMCELQLKTTPIHSGQIIIVDFKGVPTEIIPKLFTSATLSAFHFFQNALPIRMKAIICINSTPTADIFCNQFLKRFFNAKLSERIYVYPDHKSLGNHLPMDMLPSDYGGKSPSMKQLHDDLKSRFSEYRDWFITDGCKCSNDNLRPKQNHLKNDDELHGTFLKLDID